MKIERGLTLQMFTQGDQKNVKLPLNNGNNFISKEVKNIAEHFIVCLQQQSLGAALTFYGVFVWCLSSKCKFKVKPCP